MANPLERLILCACLLAAATADAETINLSVNSTFSTLAATSTARIYLNGHTLNFTGTGTYSFDLIAAMTSNGTANSTGTITLSDTVTTFNATTGITAGTSTLLTLTGGSFNMAGGTIQGGGTSGLGIAVGAYYANVTDIIAGTAGVGASLSSGTLIATNITGSAAAGCNVTGGGNLTVTGTVTTGSVTCITVSGAATLVLGDVYAGSAGGAYGVNITTTTGVNVTANNAHGSNGNFTSHGIYASTSITDETITILGTAYGGTGNTYNSTGVYMAGGGMCTVACAVGGTNDASISAGVQAGAGTFRIASLDYSQVGPPLGIGYIANTTQSGALIQTASGVNLSFYNTHGVAKIYYDSQTSGGGTGTIPAASDVRHGTATGSTTGTLYVPSPSLVYLGTLTDNTSGTLTIPTSGQVSNGVTFGVGGTGTTGTLNSTDPGGQYVSTATGTYYINSVAKTPTCVVPATGDVRQGTLVNATSGTLAVPDPGLVYLGASTDNTSGGLTLTASSNVEIGTLAFGQSGGTGAIIVVGSRVDTGCSGSLIYTGTSITIGGVVTSGTLTLPATGSVTRGTTYGIGGTGSTGSGYDVPIPSGDLSAGYTATQNLGQTSVTGTMVGSLATSPPASQNLSSAWGGVSWLNAAGSAVWGTATLTESANVVAGTPTFGAGGSGVVGIQYIAAPAYVYAGTLTGTGIGTLTVPAGTGVWWPAGQFGLGGTGSTATMSGSSLILMSGTYTSGLAVRLQAGWTLDQSTTHATTGTLYIRGGN